MRNPAERIAELNEQLRWLRDRLVVLEQELQMTHSKPATKHDIHQAERRIVNAIYRRCGQQVDPPSTGAGGFDVRIGVPINKKAKEIEMLTVDLKNTNKIRLTLSPGIAASGKPRNVDGPVVWTTLEGNSASVVPVDDTGLIVDIISYDDAVGDTKFLARADAQEGPAVVDLTQEVLVSVSSPNADTLGGTFGPEVPKDAPNPAPEPIPAPAGQQRRR